MSVDHLDQHSGARILRGEQNYWFLGPGGVARLRAGQVTATGALTSGVERRLREKGLFS